MFSTTGSLTHPRAKARVVALAVLVAIGLIASACSSGSDDGATDAADAAPTAEATAESPLAAGEEDDDGDGDGDGDDGELVMLPPHNVTLVSSDGTAFAGSRSVVELRNVETSDTVLVPVEGSGEATKLELSLPPGTYEIASTGRQISPTASYEVAAIAPATIVIEEPTDEPQSPVTVDFSLETQMSPFDLRLDAVTTSEVSLIWENLGSADIAFYELAFTEGSTPAGPDAEAEAVPLEDPTATTATVDGLEPATEYTFTMFAFDSSGNALEFRSITATTAPADGSEPAYALAPNTIVATDFEALQPQLVSPDRVQITLSANTASRSSTTEIPGVALTDVTAGCVVGTPFIASTEVAGTESFYGLIESCGEVPPGWRTAQGAPDATAVINTDVPLAAVVPYLHIRDAQVTRCIDASGVVLGPADPLCTPNADADGDGASDSAERALGLDPGDPSDGLLSWAEPDTETVTGEPIELADVEAPVGLGSGRVQVTLLWTSGDDLDLQVTDSHGVQVSQSNPRGATGGELDRDDLGDSDCGSSQARAENVFWQTSAPVGVYTVHVENYVTGRDACTELPQARLQVRVDGTLIRDDVIEVGTTPDITFEVADTYAATNDLEVTIGWWGPDDISVHISALDPVRVTASTTAFAVDDETGPFEVSVGGAYDSSFVVERFNGDPSCASTEWRTETIVFAEGQGVPAQYEVSVGNSEMSVYDDGYTTIAQCNDVVDAHLQVRARGDLVVDEVVDICDCENSPYFTVSEYTSEFFNFELGEAPQGWQSALAARAAPTVTCARLNAVIPANQFEPHFGFDAFHDVDIELKGAALTWDIEAGITAFIDPNIKVEAGVECSLDIDGATFQLATVPVPVNLELAPVLKGSATGSFNLDGPRLELTFGLKTEGAVDARLETCGWFEIPCGVDLNTRVSAEPLGDFSVGEATMQVEGELALGIGIGVEATVGVGVKNTFVTAKTGFAMTLQPLVGRVKATAGLEVNQQVEPVDQTETVDGTIPFSWSDPRITWRDPAAGVRGNNVVGYSFSEATLECPDWFVEAERRATSFTNVFYTDVFTEDLWVCADAYCLDSLNYISTVFSSCDRAQCLVNRQQVVSRPNTARSDAGEICPIPAPVVALSPSGSPLSLCAAASIGGELSVDFRAETFVLAWGKDKRYPIFKGEFDYPGASFELGDC